MIHIYSDFDEFLKGARKVFSGFNPNKKDAQVARESKFMWFYQDGGDFHLISSVIFDFLFR